VIAALERHRQGAGVRLTTPDWATALSNFVAEHARNAGPTLYYLHFSAEVGSWSAQAEVRRIGAGYVRAAPGDWLLESFPILVTR
jgi:hypothetical protein